MKVFLVYPPWQEQETLAGYSREMMKDIEPITSPPLGLCYIAAVLREEGHEVKIFDCQFSDQRDLLFKSLRKEKPDFVGVSLFTASVVSSFELIKKIKKKPLKKIDGIAYRYKGKIKFNKPRKFIKNLDSLPFPARELLPDIFRYRTEIEKLSREPYTSMVTSRGCPYRCAYCSKTVFGRVFRTRSAKNVVDEMEHLINVFGVKHIHIYDDTFNAEPKRVFEICDEIIKRKLSIIWSCNARADTVDKEMLKKMRKAGCWKIGKQLKKP